MQLISDERRIARQLGIGAGLLLLIALPLSGPLGMLIANAVAPQPPWRDAATFIQHYHPIQSLPFLVGFLLLAGFPALHVALYLGAPPRARPWALLGLVFTAVFCALIAFNYIAQTALVPAAVERRDPATIAALSMASPSSVCWSIEMFGYGFLGLGSLCVVPCFRGGGIHAAAATLLAANGMASVVGAALTAHRAAWVLTPAGLWSFLGWNAVILSMVLTVVLSLRRGPTA
jgi:hypothetical protein